MSITKKLRFEVFKRDSFTSNLAKNCPNWSTWKSQMEEIGDK